MIFIAVIFFAGFIPLTTVFNLEIADLIPECLLKEEDKSNHASTMFNEPTFDVGTWFKTHLVMPLQWDLHHPDDVPADASNSFDFESYS